MSKRFRNINYQTIITIVSTPDLTGNSFQLKVERINQELPSEHSRRIYADFQSEKCKFISIQSGSQATVTIGPQKAALITV